jgi:hypothetical protein
MQKDNPSRSAPKRIPWNKGKLTGPKPPLRTKNVWSIRTKLQVEGRVRDVAMFNFAIDSKLRACDVVHVHEIDARHHFEQLAASMEWGSVAGRCCGSVALAG